MLPRTLKFAVSGALIVWLLSSVDLASLRDELSVVNWKWFVYANLLTPFGVAIGVWRWQVFMNVNRLYPGFGSLTNFWLIGQFFSNFLPTSIGGDVVKATLAARRCGPGTWPHTASSVLVARVAGLLGMFVVLPLGVIANYGWLESLGLQLPLMLAFLGLVGLSILIFSDLGNSVLCRAESLPYAGSLAGLVRRLHDSILNYRGARRSLFVALALAAALTLESALQVWLLTKIFPHEVPWTSLIVVFVVVSLLAMLPITINGFGLQEGTFMLLLVSLGMTPGQGLIVAIAYRLVSLLVASAGGIAFAFSGKPTPTLIHKYQASL